MYSHFSKLDPSLIRISCSIISAFVLSIVLLLLPLGMVVHLPTPTIGDGSVILNQIPLSIGAETVHAVGGISITLTTDQTTAQQNDQIIYQIRVENNGVFTYTNPTEVTSELPNGVECVGTSNIEAINWVHSTADCIATGIAKFELDTGQLFSLGEVVTMTYSVNVTIPGPAILTSGNTVFNSPLLVNPITSTSIVAVSVLTTSAALSKVVIAGPTMGNSNTSYNFSAVISPVSTTPPITYIWSPMPDSGQGTANASYQWANNGSYTISVTSSNVSGTASTSHTIIITDGPTPLSGVMITGPMSGTINTLYNYSAITTPISATQPVTYIWSPTPNSGQGTANASYQWAISGTYIISVTASNLSGAVFNTYAITILSDTVALSGVTINGPNNGNINTLYNYNATISPVTATLPITYLWSPTPDSGQGTAYTNYQWGTPGTYTISLTTGNISGTVLTSYTVVITVPSMVAPASVTIAGPTEGDVNTAYNFMANVNPISATTPVTYSWQASEQISVTNSGVGLSNQVSYTWNTVGTKSITVSANNGVGVVTTTHTLLISETAIAGLTASNNSPTVLGEATTLNASITEGNNVSYNWNFGDGTTGTGSTVNHTYNAVGNYTAIVTASNLINVVTATTNVTINPKPDVAIAGLTISNDGPTQLGSRTSFEASVTAGTNVSYSWNFGDGTSSTGTASPQHTYGAVGVYTVTVRASNSQGSSSATTIVTVEDVPITGLNATNSSPASVGNAVTFNAVVAGGTGTISYTWNFGDGATGSGAIINHSYTMSGTYIATVVAINSSSLATTTTQVVINAPISDTLITGLTAINDGPTQPGKVTRLSALVSGGSNISYTWDFGDGTTGNGAVVDHTYPDIGVYTATVTASNSVNTIMASTQVVVQDEPITGLKINHAQAVGVNDSVSMEASVTTGSGVTYQWSFGDGTTGNGAMVSHTYTTVGMYTISVTATNSLGNQTSQTFISVESPPTGLMVHHNSPVYLSQSTILSANVTSGNNVTYQWDFGDGTTGNGAMVEHVYQQPGNYTVIVIASNGAGQLSETISVTVLEASSNEGLITGLVASERTGEVIEGIQVCASPFNWRLRSGCATTTSSGFYQIVGLDTGAYRLKLYDPKGRYLSEYFNDTSSWSDATRIQVVKGQPTELAQILLSSASLITGQVTDDSSGTPLKDIHVYAYKNLGNNRWGWSGSTHTDSNGRYSVGHLTAGTYRIGFFDWQNRIYFTTYYNSVDSLENGQDVVVASESTISDIDVALMKGGHIQGKVTDSSGNPLANMNVQVRYLDNHNRWRWVGSSQTDANGNYDVSGLNTGNYRLMVSDGVWPQRYHAKYYDDKNSWDEATDISVTLGQTTANINIQMDSPGLISGKVSDNTGLGLNNIHVQVYQQQGNQWRQVSWGVTDSNGNYLVSALNSGTYRVGFLDWSWPRKFVHIYYEGASNLNNGTDVTVTNGVETENINAVLERVGKVQGKVTDHNGNPVPNIRPRIYRQEGNNWVEMNSWALTDGAGKYEVTGLPSGVVRVGFTDRNRQFIYGYYDGATTLDSGTDVVINADQTISDIDFQFPPPAPPQAEVELGNGRNGYTAIDPVTGQVVIGQPWSSRNHRDIKITKAITCETGTPTDVTLNLGTFKTYPMTNSTGDNYSATIPKTDLRLVQSSGGATITVSKTCDGQTEESTIGRIILYDPSGFVTDALTGEAIEGATVTLYNVPDWLPKQAPDDTTPNTCQSHLSKAEGDPWDQVAPTGISIVADTNSGTIDPATNPLFTDEVGHYAWDVAEGCWYIVVQADGYETQTSPVVGAPPEVTDLNMELVPYPTLQFSTEAYQVDEAVGIATITVTVRSILTQPVSVQYSVANNTAIAGEDYELVSGELTFNVGDNYQIITIPISDDISSEYPETLLVTLSEPTNIELGRTSVAAITINDNDEPTVQFTATSYQVPETVGSAVITVTLNSTATQDVAVTYQGADKTASVNSDYQPISGTLVISAGHIMNTFMVDIVDDTVIEVTETISLTLHSPLNATLGTPIQAELSILDDDKSAPIYLPMLLTNN